MRIYFTMIALLVTSMMTISHAWAQSDIMPDEYYRSMTKNQLNYRLPSKSLSSDSLGRQLGSFGSGNCPDQINIGGIPEGTDIFGNVDIDVVINQDIFIDCR
jgi:hypothetical protein